MPAGVTLLARTAAFCTSAELAAAPDGQPAGDPTELTLLDVARRLGTEISARARDAARRTVFHFDPRLKRMSTIDAEDDGVLAVHTKGAPKPSCRAAAKSSPTAVRCR